MTLAIDHIVICVPDLEQSVRDFEELHGVVSLAGGHHEGHGTANRLIPLGNAYIEMLAVVDPKQAKTSALGTWAIHRAAVPGADALCLSTDDLDEVADRFEIQQMPMSRVTPDGIILSWRLAGLRQALSQGLPFFISWDIPDDLHPGRADVQHPSGPVGLGEVVISGNAKELSEWVGTTPGVTVSDGDPGVSYELVALGKHSTL